jgi:hypothetical protein
MSMLARKYLCPLACGKADSCEHKDGCSASDYGRTVYLKTKVDLRYFQSIPGDSRKYREFSLNAPHASV